jgi:hypothetical protein
MASGKRYTTLEYINLVKEIHNNKYNYSLVNYKNAHTKIKINCPIHGWFEQKPYQHLNGHGCKKCDDEKNGIRRKKNVKTIY